MDLIFFLTIVVSIVGTTYSSRDYYDTYLYKTQTRSINGIFVLLVFLRHFKQYIAYGAGDQLFLTIDYYLDQLIVTTFLFYSGYGISYSLKTKTDYNKTIPRRIFRLWLQFAVIVTFFLIICIIRCEQLSFGRVLLSFVAWESLGNSNWYIFVIILMYFFTFVATKVSNNSKTVVAIVTIGCLFYSILMMFSNKGSSWYSTVLCYPLGLIYGEYCEKINLLLKQSKTYWTALFVDIMLFLTLYLGAVFSKGFFSMVLLELRAIPFVMIIVIASMRFHIGNRLTEWLGKYIFEIYMLQRIPMIIMSDLGINKYVYFIICLAVTIALSIAFKFCSNKIEFKLRKDHVNS